MRNTAPRRNQTPEMDGAQGRNRTTDTAIFSCMLYQLSYLGAGPRKGRLVRAGGVIEGGSGAVHPRLFGAGWYPPDYSSASGSRGRGRSGSSSVSFTGIA